MTVVLARIDQRLIHGITVNQWNNLLKPKRFMIVDEEISQDEDLKASIRLSKPAGTGMSIIDSKKAISNFLAGKYDEQRVFILVKEPATLVKLVESGVKIPKINVGIMFEEDDRTPVTKRVALNDQEKSDLVALANLGIPVDFQYTPSDVAKSLPEIMKKGWKD